MFPMTGDITAAPGLSFLDNMTGGVAAAAAFTPACAVSQQVPPPGWSLPMRCPGSVTYQSCPQNKSQVPDSSRCPAPKNCPMVHSHHTPVDSPAPIRRTLSSLAPLSFCCMMPLPAEIFPLLHRAGLHEAFVQWLFDSRRLHQPFTTMLCHRRWERRRPQTCCALPSQAPPRSCTWTPPSLGPPQLHSHHLVSPDA